jgi:raffinose synthase
LLTSLFICYLGFTRKEFEVTSKRFMFQKKELNGLFHLTQNQGKITIENDGKVMIRNVVPSVTWDNNVKEQLPFTSYKVEDSFETKVHIFTYGFKEGENEVVLTVRFHIKGQLMWVTTGMTSTSNPVELKCRYVASEGAVRLHFESLDQVDGLLATYHHKDWWTRPYFDHNLENLPKRTQNILWKSGDRYNYLLPLCGSAFKTEFFGVEEGGFEALVSSYDGGFINFDTPVLVLGSGSNPFDLIMSQVELGLEITGNQVKPRVDRRYPDMLEYLGWCSWDAFYQEVSEAGVLVKAQEFNDLNLPIGWVIVDDGWSDTNSKHELVSFGTVSDRFPNGFSSLISKLKNIHGVKWVGVWHEILGYWRGVDKTSQLAMEMRDYLVETNRGNLVPSPEASKAFPFWNRWHSELKRQGVDFLKVDHQSVLNTIHRGNVSIGKAAKEAHLALEASVGVNFDQRLINCMGMAIENFWNRPISAINRNSDDFFPKHELGFHEHALQNVYNALLNSTLYWPDWDMFWSKHQDATQSALLRAVSGGPVYISDGVGKTDPETLWPVIFNDGKIIRCDLPALPTEDVLFLDASQSKSPIKVWNRVGHTGVVAAFHIHHEDVLVQGSVRPTDVPNLEGNQFLIYEYFSKTSYVVNREDAISIQLAKDESSLFTIIPLAERYASIGLVNKYISRATIAHEIVSDSSASILLVEGGQFAFYSERKPTSIRVNGHTWDKVSSTNNVYTISCSEIHGKVLVDISYI